MQSGVTELWCAVKQDNKHYVVVSSVEGETWCAVTAILPDYGDYQCNNIAIVKAGVINGLQIRSLMVLFPHCALINPHLPSQLPNFTPIMSKKQMRDEDLLDQSPDVNHNKHHSNAQYHVNITHLDIDKFISARAKTQAEELPDRIKRLGAIHKQMLSYDYFSDWAGHMFIMIGLRLKAKDKAEIKANTLETLLY